ncbi:MAG: radical SAM family heme chaperone HemW [Verrucomicrobiota bacterium]|nr:radical SAM family heme chaperone HemW [Verrucomicrobiota bacterium]
MLSLSESKKVIHPEEESPLGLYFHVPFCSSTCDFCAFYQKKPSKKEKERYFLALKEEISSISADRLVSSVFVGGGTPGLLSERELINLGELIRTHRLAEGCEWSIELAPSEINARKLEVLRDMGVNRISLGVQTFDDRLMTELGRDHSPDKAREAFENIRSLGFDSVNLDLIFGIPGQSLEGWKADLHEAVNLEPEHISTYCLTFEEDTALYYRLSRGELKIDSERDAQFYEVAWDFLPSCGFGQYEVSNFARPGQECIHNLNTWHMNEWIGFGPSACTQFKGERRKNFSSLQKWSEVILESSEIQYEEFEKLSPYDLARDALVFGLRMNAGINFREIARKYDLADLSFEPVVKFLKLLDAEGMGVLSDQSFRLTSRGRIIADGIASELPDMNESKVDSLCE